MDQAFIPLRSKILLCLSYLLIALAPPPLTHPPILCRYQLILFVTHFWKQAKANRAPKTSPTYTDKHGVCLCLCVRVCFICKHCCCCYQTTLIRQVAAVAEATLNQRRVGVPRIVYNKKSAPTVCSSSSDSASGVYC